MDKILSVKYFRKYTLTYLLDICALLFIYFIPTFSHLTNAPLYLFEPMRIFIILALLHSNKTNAYILAITLPIFSFTVASHPVFLKSIIMSVELALNVFLFNALLKKKINGFLSVFLSIAASKLAYYLLKFILVQSFLIQSDVVSTPIYIQIIVTVLLSFYGLAILMYKNHRSSEL